MAARVKEQLAIEKVKKVYCGPNIPGLTQFTVLEGIPKYIEMHIETCPAVEKLLVPIEKLSATRLKLAVKGSYEQKIYGEILKYMGGVK